jgi:uncharacterized protein YjbI with pentapeptide repeats
VANEEHLLILRQGPDVWNKWREQNPETTPNLLSADLSEEYLSGANLSGGFLRAIDFSDAKLSDADLSGANLKYAKLIGADLNGADLNGADLGGADLSGANLHYAKLIGADLHYAKLDSADLSGADLNGANLSNAHLFGTNLIDAKLIGADLRDALLHAARLINAKLDEANLTGACLWETQRAGWSIRGISCESIYWGKKWEEKATYQLGDFERLFTDKTKIRLLYQDGISPLEIATLPALIQHLEASYPGCGLRLVSIREESGGAVVELAIEDFNEYSPHQLKQLQSGLEAEARERIEYQRQALLERDTRLHLEGEIKQLNLVVEKVIDKLALRPSIYVNNQGGFMGDKYDISGQAGAIGPNANAHDMTFNQVWNQLQGSIDLPKLADELSRLRQEMKKEAIEPGQDIAVSEIAKAEQSAKAGEGSKTLEHLKSAGKWALDIATKIGTSLAVEALKKSLG